LAQWIVASNRDEVGAWLNARQQNPGLIDHDAGMTKVWKNMGDTQAKICCKTSARSLSDKGFN